MPVSLRNRPSRTTAGCLEMLASVARSRPVATRSTSEREAGVLAIAAWKLLHVPVLATDIDPIANPRRRRQCPSQRRRQRLDLRHGARLPLDTFSANGPFTSSSPTFLARPLMKMAPQLVAKLAPGGSVSSRHFSPNSAGRCSQPITARTSDMRAPSGAMAG
ncbi:hypothetical protein F2981_17610 [Sinorhizobium meliloti]|nr:hypothetical protein [Sinorhizobium meliloti]